MEAHQLPGVRSAPLRRVDILARAGIAAGVAILLSAAATDTHPRAITVALCGAALFAASHRWLLAWRTLVGLIVLVILIIPIKRYALPAHLPLQLEPYRLIVGGIGLAVAGTLLIDPTLRTRRTGFEGPLAAIVGAMALSVLTRTDYVIARGLGSDVTRSAMFFASYLVVFAVVTVAIRKRSEVDYIIKLLVGLAAVVAATAIYESITGYNVFDHLHTAIPILRFNGVPYVPDRGGARAYASGQHPIAMGATLMMLTPLALYLVQRTGDRRWWFAFGLLFIGALATKSRTAVIMMVVILVAMLILRPAATRRALPALIPLLLVTHLAMPGTIGTFKDALFPSNGIVQSEKETGAEWHSNYGRGRIGEWGPALKEVSHTPLLGQGFGTRISDLDSPHYNSPILDDQWLWSLLELGIVGVVALLWFFVSLIRKLGHRARRDAGDDGWLLATLAASIASFAVSMLTFDAFAFVQCTLLMFILAGLGVVVLRMSSPEQAAT